MNDREPSTGTGSDEEHREHAMDDATTVKTMGVLIGGMALLAIVIFIGVNVFF